MLGLNQQRPKLVPCAVLRTHCAANIKVINTIRQKLTNFNTLTPIIPTETWMTARLDYEGRQIPVFGSSSLIFSFK